MRRLFPIVGVLLIAAAAFIMISLSTISTAQGAAFAPTATAGVAVNSVPLSANVDLSSLGSPRVLAWNNNVPLLAWYGAKGQPVPLAKPASGKSIVMNCGKNPTSDKALIFQGDTTQTNLVPLDSGTILPISKNVGLSCAIPGLIQISPDGSRLATIDFDQTVGNNPLTPVSGLLHLISLSDGKQLVEKPTVASFDLQNDGVTYIEFFTNSKQQANSAELHFVDNNGNDRSLKDNLALSNTDDKKICYFVSAKVLRVSDKVYTMLGEKCTPGNTTTWRIHRTDFAGGVGTDIVPPTPTGKNGVAIFSYQHATNEMYLLPGGKDILFAVPNGDTLDLADIARLNLDKGDIQSVIGGVTMPQYPPTGPVHFLFSPKGDKLAMVTRIAANVEQVFIYDLTALDKAPVVVPSSGSGKIADADHVTGLAWTGDSSKLFFTMTGQNQAMYSFDPSSGQSTLIVHGVFQGLAVNNDGTQASSNEVVNPTPKQVRNNLVVISVNDGTKTNLVEGVQGDQPIVPMFVR